MASYHRVLEVFGRSVHDVTRECDCDIHPWEITVDGKTWPGRIRLIAFVDVFFVISYASNERFLRGILIYKDAIALKRLNKKCGVPHEDKFEFKKGSVFVVNSLGHEIGMKATLPTSEIKSYRIEINRPHKWALGRQMKRGLQRHSLPRMMQDVLRSSLIQEGKLVSQVTGSLLAGGRWNDTISRTLSTAVSASGAERQTLANERT